MNLNGYYDHIKTFINGSASTGFTYLTAITAVIAAFIPLTTIIFAQYYDKSAERANEYLWDIKEELDENNGVVNYSSVRNSFKKMVYVGGNSTFFNVAIVLFSLVSLVLLVLWGIGANGYLANAKDPVSATDKFIVISSSTVLIALLIALPVLFFVIKKRVPLKIVNAGCTLSQFKEIFEVETNQLKNRYYNDLLDFKLTVPKLQRVVEVNVAQSIPISRYHVLFNVHVSPQTFIIIKLAIKQGRTKYKFQVVNSLRDRLRGRNNIPTSIIQQIESAVASSSLAFVRPYNEKGAESVDSSNIKILDQSNALVHTFDGFQQLSLMGVNTLLNRRGSFIKVFNGSNEIEYPIKLVK